MAAKVPEIVYDNFRLALAQKKLVTTTGDRYSIVDELKITDPEDLKRLDEDDATWVNLWRVATKEKHLDLSKYK